MKPLALILTIASALLAQSAGEIRGYAWDASGRPVADAAITVHAVGRTTDRTIAANKNGAFELKDMAPGRYELTASSTKLQLTTEDVTPLEVKPGETRHADLTLGQSTVHYGFWKRLGRRLDGIH